MIAVCVFKNLIRQFKKKIDKMNYKNYGDRLVKYIKTFIMF